jgi:hypothetical protein
MDRYIVQIKYIVPSPIVWQRGGAFVVTRNKPLNGEDVDRVCPVHEIAMIPWLCLHSWHRVNPFIFPFKVSPRQCQLLYIQGVNIDSMPENPPKPSAIRIIAAVILGIFVGFFLFLGIALVIGAFNDTMGMNIPVTTQFAENAISAFLLILIIIACIAAFCWKVWTSPPTTPEFETPETIDKF